MICFKNYIASIQNIYDNLEFKYQNADDTVQIFTNKLIFNLLEATLFSLNNFHGDFGFIIMKFSLDYELTKVGKTSVFDVDKVNRFKPNKEFI